MSERLTDVRYARSGEVYIAYTVAGAGPVDIVLVEGYLTTLSILWENPGYRRWIDRLASLARVIPFDKRAWDSRTECRSARWRSGWTTSAPSWMPPDPSERYSPSVPAADRDWLVRWSERLIREAASPSEGPSRS